MKLFPGLVTLLACGSAVWAAPRAGLQQPIQPTIQIAPEPPPPAPDIAVVDLRVDAGCHPVAVLQNVGGAAASATASIDLSVKYFLNGQQGAGYSPSGDAALLPAGGTLEHSWGAHIVNGSEKLKVTVTAAGTGESNTGNNWIEKTLTCAPRLPDISIKVSFMQDCSTAIVLENQGEGSPPDGFWLGSISRSVDGAALRPLAVSLVDPNHRLAVPGGRASYREPLAARAFASYAYAVPEMLSLDRVAHRASAAVDRRCQGARPAIDAAVTDLTVDSMCQVHAFVQNMGPGLLPPVWATSKIWLDGQSRGGHEVILTSAGAVGAAAQQGTGIKLPGPSPKAAAATVRFDLDPLSIGESSTNNNSLTRTLRCTGFTPVQVDGIKLAP